MKSPDIFDEELLYECYECARCTGSCPAALAVDGFNPRNFLLTCLRLGLDAVVSDEKLWCCTTCHVCEDRCPQMLDVTDLLMTLMNEAAGAPREASPQQPDITAAPRSSSRPGSAPAPRRAASAPGQPMAVLFGFAALARLELERALPFFEPREAGHFRRPK
jgi:L-lactate utilization protein LutB